MTAAMSLTGESSFSSLTGVGRNCWRDFDDSFSLTMRLALLFDFRRPLGVPVAGVFAGGAMMIVVMMTEGGWEEE